MQMNLSSDTMNWLESQVKLGHFSTYEEAIDYSVRLTSLRETMLASMADPRRFTVDTIRANLKEHFARRRANETA